MLIRLGFIFLVSFFFFAVGIVQAQSELTVILRDSFSGDHEIWRVNPDIPSRNQQLNTISSANMRIDDATSLPNGDLVVLVDSFVTAAPTYPDAAVKIDSQTGQVVGAIDLNSAVSPLNYPNALFTCGDTPMVLTESGVVLSLNFATISFDSISTSFTTPWNGSQSYEVDCDTGNIFATSAASSINQYHYQTGYVQTLVSTLGSPVLDGTKHRSGIVAVGQINYQNNSFVQPASLQIGVYFGSNGQWLGDRQVPVTNISEVQTDDKAYLSSNMKYSQAVRLSSGNLAILTTDLVNDTTIQSEILNSANLDIEAIGGW